VTQIAEAIFAAGIIVMAVLIGNEDPIKTPYRIDVCLVASGPNAEDVTTNLWSDQIKVYFEKYPNSYCGRCGQKRECPKED
jgi:hypothetical protein